MLHALRCACHRSTPASAARIGVNKLPWPARRFLRSPPRREMETVTETQRKKSLCRLQEDRAGYRVPIASRSSGKSDGPYRQLPMDWSRLQLKIECAAILTFELG